jgi:hypothetical protein
MGLVKQPVRFTKKVNQKKVVMVTLKVEKDDVTKLGNINNVKTKNVLQKNEQIVSNLASNLAREVIYENVKEDDRISDIVKNEEINKTNCLNPSRLLFSSGMAFLTGGAIGAIIPTIQCLGQKIFTKLVK